MRPPAPPPGGKVLAAACFGKRTRGVDAGVWGGGVRRPALGTRTRLEQACASGAAAAGLVRRLPPLPLATLECALSPVKHPHRACPRTTVACLSCCTRLAHNTHETKKRTFWPVAGGGGWLLLLPTAAPATGRAPWLAIMVACPLLSPPCTVVSGGAAALHPLLVGGQQQLRAGYGGRRGQHTQRAAGGAVCAGFGACGWRWHAGITLLCASTWGAARLGAELPPPLAAGFGDTGSFGMHRGHTAFGWPNGRTPAPCTFAPPLASFPFGGAAMARWAVGCAVREGTKHPRCVCMLCGAGLSKTPLLWGRGDSQKLGASLTEGGSPVVD